MLINMSTLIINYTSSSELSFEHSRANWYGVLKGFGFGSAERGEWTESGWNFPVKTEFVSES